MTKTRALSAGLAFIAIALAMWALSIWPFGGEHVAAPAHRTSAVDAPTEARDAELAYTTAERQTIAEGDAPESAPAAPTMPAAAATVSETVPVAAWLVRLRVVDERDRPVANASVTAWAARRTAANAGDPQRFVPGGNTYAGRVKPALVELQTDAEGRAQATFAVELVYVEARKDDVGCTPELMFWSTQASEREVALVLQAPRTLRGVVLRADGSPAAGAQVTSTPLASFRDGNPVPAEAVDTGIDGRFELIVERHSTYELRAQLDGARTFAQRVWVLAEPPDQVTLRFPGGMTLRGVVVDATGAPVAHADVSCWRDFTAGAWTAPQGVDPQERGDTRTDENGQFSISVRRLARYQVIASKHGHANSKSVWLETTEVRPHAEARVQLCALATIRGRVERGDGSPFARALVVGTPEAGEVPQRTAMPSHSEVYGKLPRATAGEDGTFELTVHPDPTWTVVARPAAGSRIQVARSRVVPSSEGVVLRLTDADLATCTVHGVVSRDDGEPVLGYQVDLVAYATGKPPAIRPAGAVIDGPGFTVSGLPRGKQYALRVRLLPFEQPVAPVLVGPFTTDQSELKLEFPLPLWGRVPVRVLDSTGAPAAKVRVSIDCSVPMTFRMQPRPVGADGDVLPQCVPGHNTLRVYREGAVHEQPLHVTPGPNAEVIVQLPAGK